MTKTRREFSLMAAAGGLVAASPSLAQVPAASTKIPAPWTVMALQRLVPEAALASAKTKDDVMNIVRTQIAIIDQQLERHGDAKPDLVLTGEFFLKGGKGPNNIGVIPFPGPEIELVQKFAAKRRVFVVANTYSRNPKFADRFMNTSFIVDRTGNIVLRGYRLHTNHSVSPHDFLNEFLDKEGIEGLFPVADTELGKLSCITAMEFNYPEVSRAVVLRGAEVLLHVSSDGIVDRSVKRARAIENEAWVVSANVSNRKGIHPSMEVGSCVIDWRGEVLAQVPQNTEGECIGPVNVGDVRAKRGDMDFAYKGWGPNYLARMRVEMFRDIYGKTTIFPANRYTKGFPINSSEDMTGQKDLFLETRDNMKRLGMKLTES